MRRRPKTIQFWQGQLPHWEVEDGRYFITIHLAGAIPQPGRQRISALSNEFKLAKTVSPNECLERNRRIFHELEIWLDQSTHVAHLVDPNIAQMVLEAVQHRHKRVWNVFEYVLMPNHIHLFLEILQQDLKQTLQAFKRWTGHQAAKLIQLEHDCFWQDEWFDHWSRSDTEDLRIIEYIRQNPVKARLVDEYQRWSYSSWSTRQ